MAGFKRVFNTFPGFNVLGNIESVNIIDIPPPAAPLGAGTIVVCCIGEFENGEFERPTRVFGGTDLQNTFGGFGFTKSGELHKYPVAQQSANAAQPWEGSGFIALRNKTFAGLIITRVDSTPGSVEFTRLACLVGDAGPYDLADTETVSISIDGGAPVVGTVNASRAVKAGAGFPGDVSQVWQVDDSGGPSFVDETADFNSATDADFEPFPSSEAIGDWVAFGFVRPFDSLIFDGANGTAGVGGTVEWEYWDGSAWQSLSGVSDGTSGFTAAVADGQVVSWTVPNDWAAQVINASASLYYVRARVTATYTTNPIYDQGFVEHNGVTGFSGGETLELKIDGGGTRVVTFPAAAQTPTQVVDEINSQTASDIAVLNSGEVDLRSIVAGTAGSIEVVGGTGARTIGQLAGTAFGSGNVANVDQVTTAEMVTILDALTGVAADTTPDGELRICNSANPGVGTIEVTAATASVGFAVGTTVDADEGGDTEIPAGTLLKDSTTDALWLTAKTTTVNGGGPFTLKVRPAKDDDSTPTAAANDIDTIVDSLPDGFVVTNPNPISRLNAVQMDTRYLNAFNATLDVNGIANDIDVVFSARATANIHRFGRENAVKATQTGHNARKFVAAPPVATSRTDAKADTGVGVGANRNERVFYTFPGMATFIPEIASLPSPTSRGVGFTADGVIDVKSDGFYASVRSQLPPEENAGQALGDTNVGSIRALSLESAYDPEGGGVGLTIDDYIDFKANGIIAPRVDRTSGLVFQSDITSVDPNTNPALVDAKRRWMGDFIINALASISAGFVKKLNTPRRRRALISAYDSFLTTLQSPNLPDAARVENFQVVDETTDSLRAQGFQITRVKVRLFASMDFIVTRIEVGTTVTIEEA